MVPLRSQGKDDVDITVLPEVGMVVVVVVVFALEVELRSPVMNGMLAATVVDVALKICDHMSTATPTVLEFMPMLISSDEVLLLGSEPCSC